MTLDEFIQKLEAFRSEHDGSGDLVVISQSCDSPSGCVGFVDGVSLESDLWSTSSDDSVVITRSN